MLRFRPSHWLVEATAGLLVALGAAALLRARDLPPLAAAAHLGRLLLLAIVAGILLRALCLGTPPLRRLVRATLVLLAPAGALLALRAWLGAAPAAPSAQASLASLPVLLALAAGLVLALIVLKAYVRSERPMGVLGGLRAFAVAGACAWIAASAAGSFNARLHAKEVELEAAARRAAASGRSDAPDASDAPGPDDPALLGADDALFFAGPYRNADVRGRVTLSPESILQVRVRMLRPEWPEGISLFLSADPRHPTGFFLETTTGFEPEGKTSGTLESGRPLDVHVAMRGRHVTAFVDGRIVGRVDERRFAEGAVAWLAVRGIVEVHGATVANVAYGEPSLTQRADAAAGAAAVIVALLAFSWVAARFLRVRWLRAMEPCAIGLLPFAAAFAAADPLAPRTEAAPLVALLLPFAAATAILLLPLLVHAARLHAWQYFALLALLIAGDAWAYGHVTRRAWPVGAVDAEVHGLNVVDWSGERLERDFLHFQHPALRRWNQYLAAHQLPRRTPSIERDAGRPRVLFVGTSSTHGYFDDVPFAFRVELLAKERGLDLEAMIGAVPGSTGPRLYYFVRNALLEFRPDVIVLSLYFNDAFALTEMDEAAYLREITDPEYERSWWTRVQDRFELARGAARLRELRALDPGAAADAEWQDGAPPPERFAAMLRDFATLARERGARLVLVQEPVADDGPRLWKREFRAAMAQVAQEHGLALVDPTPALERARAAGATDLFLPGDRIHPTDRGAQIIAEAILPAVQQALE